MAVFRVMAEMIADAPADTMQRRALDVDRIYVAFEALGTPIGFDFWLEDAAGAAFEMGSDAQTDTLHVASVRQRVVAARPGEG
jgi:hypothetical protein